jgi:hypothetical protein
MEVEIIQIVVLTVIIVGGAFGIIYLMKKPDSPVWEPKEEAKPTRGEEPEKELNPHLQELNEKISRLPKALATGCLQEILFIPFAILVVAILAYIYSWFNK